jgi:predicted HTH transcriptional regulator
MSFAFFANPSVTAAVSSAGKILQKDSTFKTFLALTANSDRAFLSMWELHRFLPTCCGMANGAGGWVILGASPEDGALDTSNLLDKEMPLLVEGVPNASSLERELSLSLEDPRQISANPVSSFRLLSYGDKKLLAAQVEPASWFLRPLCAGARLGGTYRRIEGVDVVSGHGARLRMALDALEVTRDDLPVPGLCVSDLDAGSAGFFRALVETRFPRWKGLSEREFLRRALVLAPEGSPQDPVEEVTRAGQLLLGKDGVRVRMTRQETSEVWEVSNLWSAWADLLPRLVKNVSKPCEDALWECFMNALLHADHDEGCVEIELRGAKAVFSNLGLPRAWTAGESAARNGRLLRMFKLAGLALGEGRGLETIRAFDKNFHLQWDMLTLSTFAELPLQFEAGVFDPSGMPVVQMPQRQRPSLLDLMPLPVVAVLLAAEPTAAEPSSEFSPESSTAAEKIAMEKTLPSGLILAALPSALPEPPEEISEEPKSLSEFVDVTEREKNGHAVTKENELELSLLVKTVRNTRPSPSVVREAILELCGEYRSLPDLAAALARSEGSLRRSYVTVMVREGLLEMEFPDKIGHPEQRYKARNISLKSVLQPRPRQG